MLNSFKVRVVENIGGRSAETFGKKGSIINLKDGCFRDLEGDIWENGGKGYNSLYHLNERMSDDDPHQTVFELVEESEVIEDFTPTPDNSIIVEENDKILRKDGELYINGEKVFENSSEVEKSVNSTVNHPKHYTTGKYECIDVIEDWELGYHLGNAVKYICRHDKKGSPAEDIDKAIWYLQRYKSNLEKE